LEDVPLKDMTVGIIGDSYSAYHTWKPVLTYPFDSYVFPPSKEDSLYYGEFPCRDTRTDVRDNVKSVD